MTAFGCDGALTVALEREQKQFNAKQPRRKPVAGLAAKLAAMADLLARILFFLAALLTRLPWPWLLRLGDGIATLMLRRDTR